jgi:hypothetical protein
MADAPPPPGGSQPTVGKLPVSQKGERLEQDRKPIPRGEATHEADGEGDAPPWGGRRSGRLCSKPCGVGGVPTAGDGCAPTG